MRAGHVGWRFGHAQPAASLTSAVRTQIEMPAEQTRTRARWRWIVFGTVGLGIILFLAVPLWYEGSRSSRGLAKLIPILTSDPRFSHVKAAPSSHHVILLRGRVDSTNDLETLYQAVKVAHVGCMIAYDVGVTNLP